MFSNFNPCFCCVFFLLSRWFPNREAAEKLDLDLRNSEPGEARVFQIFPVELIFDDQVVVVVKTC